MIAWYYYSCLTGHQGKSCAAFEQTPSVSEIDEPGLWNGHQPINDGRIAVQSVYAMPINVERICNTWHDAAATLSTLTPAVDCLSHTVRNEKLRPGVLRCCTHCAVRMGRILFSLSSPPVNETTHSTKRCADTTAHHSHHAAQTKATAMHHLQCNGSQTGTARQDRAGIPAPWQRSADIRALAWEPIQQLKSISIEN